MKFNRVKSKGLSSTTTTTNPSLLRASAYRRFSERAISDRAATQANGIIDLFGEKKDGGEGHPIGTGQTPSKVLCAILDSIQRDTDKLECIRECQRVLNLFF